MYLRFEDKLVNIERFSGFYIIEDGDSVRLTATYSVDPTKSIELFRDSEKELVMDVLDDIENLLKKEGKKAVKDSCAFDRYADYR